MLHLNLLSFHTLYYVFVLCSISNLILHRQITPHHIHNTAPHVLVSYHDSAPHVLVCYHNAAPHVLVSYHNTAPHVLISYHNTAPHVLVCYIGYLVSYVALPERYVYTVHLVTFLPKAPYIRCMYM
jgi:hypothetical protein